VPLPCSILPGLIQTTLKRNSLPLVYGRYLKKKVLKCARGVSYPRTLVIETKFRLHLQVSAVCKINFACMFEFLRVEDMLPHPVSFSRPIKRIFKYPFPDSLHLEFGEQDLHPMYA
jgi:hypothetical protein